MGKEVTLEELTEATAPFLPTFLADAAELEADYDAKSRGPRCADHAWNIGT